MELLIFLSTLLVCIVLGVPIAFALLVTGVALMLSLGMLDPNVMAQNVFNGINNFSLLAIPFFVLAGEIMNAGGLSTRIIDLPMKIVGHVKGGLGFVAIIAAMIMASMSGSAVADTAAVGAMLFPMMKSSGYKEELSAGLVASGGIIAPIIPPSIPFIIFGVASGVSFPSWYRSWHYDWYCSLRHMVHSCSSHECDSYAESKKRRDPVFSASFNLGSAVAGDHHWRFSFRHFYPD